MNVADFINILEEDMTVVVYIIKTIFLSICIQYTILKVNNKKIMLKYREVLFLAMTIVCSCISIILRYRLDYLSSILSLITFLTMLDTITFKWEISASFVNVIICLSINYVIFFMTIIISFIPNIIINLQSDYINIVIMMICHIIALYSLFKIKRFAKGITFLKRNTEKDYFNIFVLNISTTIMFLCVIGKNANNSMTSSIVIILFTVSIVIFMTIKTIITMYYKHKLLISDLEETKAELESKKKEIEKLEAENLEFSKTSHTISHQLKSLKFKVKELEMSKEVADEIDISNRVQEISYEYYKKKAIVNIDKTGITEIDDMLKYMQAECINNDIEFELQLNGSIHYMVNNIIPKEKIEILLADHIKDAIIAVNHSDNINKSILVRIGLVDGVYSIYIYDSGIEFEKEALLKLGKEPITTHKDEGGTGMGFMNTFDTLKKYNASMIINEIGKPNKDNYTKVIVIKFDNKNEFEIESYKNNKI